MKKEEEKVTEWAISNEAGLWPPFTLKVHKGKVIECSRGGGVTVGADFVYLRKMWQTFDDERKYTIKEITN